MNTLDSNSREPVWEEALKVVIGTVLANLGVIYGLPVREEVKTFVVGLVSMLAPLVLGALARRRVFSPATVVTMRKAMHRRIREARAGHEVDEDPVTEPIRLAGTQRHARS